MVIQPGLCSPANVKRTGDVVLRPREYARHNVTSICSGVFDSSLMRSVSVVILSGMRLSITMLSGLMSWACALDVSITNMFSRFSASIAGSLSGILNGICKLFLSFYQPTKIRINNENAAFCGKNIAVCQNVRLRLGLQNRRNARRQVVLFVTLAVVFCPETPQTGQQKIPNSIVKGHLLAFQRPSIVSQNAINDVPKGHQSRLYWWPFMANLPSVDAQ